jgi:crotonobetainyl-CoA:carnitine CoA-transferase CaiB-like acyl-CoA transferase
MTDTRPPLPDFTVVDLGRGLAAAMVTKLLVELGMRVIRHAPAGGDPFDALYPAHHAWQAGKEYRDLPTGSPAFAAALAEADICVIGGEDLPGLDRGPDAEALLRINPRLVIASITDAPPFAKGGRPAVEILAQARSGTMAEELVDRPIFSTLPHASYGAALQVLIAMFAALYDRERTGAGRIVSSSLLEGAFSFGTPFWYSATRPNAAFDTMPPKSPKQMIFRCADGRYIHLVLGVPGAKAKLYGIFGLDIAGIDPNDRGVGDSHPRKFYGEYDKFVPLFAERTSTDVLAAMTEAGLPNVEVLPPGGCWDDPQVRALGVLKRNPDGVQLVGMPFTLSATPGRAKRSPPIRAASPAPLDGVRILDLGAWVAGPFGSVPLADLGADVIKVEPLEGDPHRFVHRSFAACNRGKTSIALDLKSPDGMAILHKLITASDVLQHNFRPGVSKRLGIDPAALHAINPDLVVIESSAYGQTGPRALRPGFDQLFQAFGGHELRAITGDAEPFWSRLNPIDVVTGLINAVATNVGLLINRRTGMSVTIEASLLQSAIYLLSEVVRGADGAFMPLVPIDAGQTGFHPAERLYRTAAGWIAIAALDDAMARRLCAVLGVDIRADRADWGVGEADLLAGAIRSRPAADLLAALDAADVWAERCSLSGEDALTDPAMLAAGMVGMSDDARYGEVRQVGALARVSGQRPTSAFASPMLGQHTDGILARLGYGPEEIGAFREQKIVR